MPLNRRNRIRKLEAAAEAMPPPPCPQCGPAIKIIRVYRDGWRLFEHCEPCSICDVVRLPEMVEDRRNDHGSEPITHLYYECIEPFAVPAIEDLHPADVLQAPDGTIYRKEYA